MVDLDGTLIKSDILIESFFALLKANPLYAFVAPFWLLRGRAHFKHKIAERVELDVALLPYRQDFLDFLVDEHRSGRRILLATASNERVANQVAGHLKIFQEVIASDAEHNLKGTEKLGRLRTLFGEGGFDYAGNDAPDLKIWPHANAAILVASPPRVREAALASARVDQVFAEEKVPLGTYLRALRVHWWWKNLLIFLPLIAAHRAVDWPPALAAGAAFLAFSLCASGVCLLNDLLNLQADRRHPRRRTGAFASGTIPPIRGMGLSPPLLIAAFSVAVAVDWSLTGVLAAYFALALAYALWFREIMLFDVLVLAALYNLRVFAGSAATGIDLSLWLLIFSTFLSLALALIERYPGLLPRGTKTGGTQG